MGKKPPLLRIRAHVEAELAALTVLGTSRREDALHESLHEAFPDFRLVAHVDRFRNDDRQARIFLVRKEHRPESSHLRLILAVRIVYRHGHWVAALPGEFFKKSAPQRRTRAGRKTPAR